MGMFLAFTMFRTFSKAAFPFTVCTFFFAGFLAAPFFAGFLLAAFFAGAFFTTFFVEVLFAAFFFAAGFSKAAESRKQLYNV